MNCSSRIPGTKSGTLNRTVAGIFPGCWVFGGVVFSLVLLPTPLANGSSKAKQKSSDAILERLDKAFIVFEKAREKADSELLKDLDQAAAFVRRDQSRAVTDKANLLEEIDDAKTAFQADRTFPVSDFLIPLSIQYLDRLQPRIAAMQNLQSEAIAKHLDDKVILEEFLRKQRAWERSLPGAGELSTPAQWHGRRVFRKDGTAVDFHLHLDSCENGILKGSVWQDAGNTWTKVGLAFEGRCDGNRVVITTTNTLHGKARKIDMAGYLIERRLVLQVLSVNGKPAGDFITLRK